MTKLGYKGHDKRTAEEIKRSQNLASKELNNAFKDGNTTTLKLKDFEGNTVSLEFKNGLLVKVT